MTLDQATVQELLRKLDADREAYIASLNRTHDLLTQVLISSTDNSAATVSSPISAISPSSRKRINSAADGESSKLSSTLASLEGDSSSDEDQSLFADQTLPPEKLREEDFREHLRTHQWTNYGKIILGNLANNSQFSRKRYLFEDELATDDPLNYTHSTVLEVGADGAPVPWIRSTESGSKAETIWQSLSSTNADPEKKQSVGRIIIVREPTPILFGALHFAMKDHFDMDGLFEMLADNTTSKMHMGQAFDSDHRHQCSYVFSFDYFCIVGDSRKPMAWQPSGEDSQSIDDNIPLTRCSAIVALSLAGQPMNTIYNKARRKKRNTGHVYDPFAPWRVLSIQCFPDWKSTTESHNPSHHYVNGPEAFLKTLLIEYRDAQKRYLEITKRIVKLVTPPPDFMFKRHLRDKLLFEDGEYTYSRRYFWAAQTLATMNDSIQAMIDAYNQSFTDEVWAGRHRSIWPGTEDKDSRYHFFRRRMAAVRKDLEAEVHKLEEIIVLNEKEQKDIKTLRDQLFSGTSVQESRKSVEQAAITVQQGHNIKLLTLVSIFFLPLTFVTSVFGMTNMPPNGSYKPFGIVTVIICLPTYLLIGSLNTTQGVKFWHDRAHDLVIYIGKVFICMFSLFLPNSSRTKRLQHQFSESSTEDLNGSGTGPRLPHRSQSATEGLEARQRTGSTAGMNLPPPRDDAISPESSLHKRTSSIKWVPEQNTSPTSLRRTMTSPVTAREKSGSPPIPMTRLVSDPGPSSTTGTSTPENRGGKVEAGGTRVGAGLFRRLSGFWEKKSRDSGKKNEIV